MLAAVGPVPVLVAVLAGNSVTSTTILGCLTTADTNALRRLHPAVAGVIAELPWCDTGTPVVDAVRWRAALPDAVGARLAPLRGIELLTSDRALAALAGVTHLDVSDCIFITDDVLLRLPPSLRVLNVRNCYLTKGATFVHLPALASLDCSWTPVLGDGAGGLPGSLQSLTISNMRSMLPGGVSLAHLTRLQVLHAARCDLDDAPLASLPPSLVELHLEHCRRLPPATSFAHLRALCTLGAAHSAIGDDSLATMPPSLVSLTAGGCKNLTRAAVLPPHLPAMRLLDVSCTAIGDALVASLPAGLTELWMFDCSNVTAGARLDHVPALQTLHCIDTELAPGALADCRARGCVVPESSVLRGHQHTVWALALLPDGRLASGGGDGEVRLWDTGTAAGSSEATAVLHAGGGVYALAALPDGRRLAVGTRTHTGSCYVEMWDVQPSVPPACGVTVDCSSAVQALAVLADGRLAAGCGDGAVRVVDVDTGAIVAELEGYDESVMTLVAAFPNGQLASSLGDEEVQVWDAGAGDLVAILVGHVGGVHSMAVLPDGRLACGTGESAVILWDVATHTSVRVLDDHRVGGLKLAALPDGRLAVGSTTSVRLLDTRPEVAATSSCAVGAAPVVMVAQPPSRVDALLLLPDGRLACAASGRKGTLYLLDLPPPAS